MHEIVLTRPEQFDLRDAEPCGDFQSPDQVRVRVRTIGICGTDIHAYYGRQPFFEYPRVLGHELAVEVTELASPSETTLQVGDLCAVEPYLHNSNSPASRRGKTNCCEDLAVLGVHMDGGMRPDLILPAEKLHPSATLTSDQLALVETLCIGAHAVERARPGAEEFCVVIGAGPIGLGCAAFAARENRHVAVVDVQEARLGFCRDAIGIPQTVLFDPNNAEALAGQLRNVSGGDLPTLIIDATGNAHSMASCFDLAANGGRIVFAGLFQGDLAFHDPTFHRKELSILATRNATASTFNLVMAAIASGEIDPAPWISDRVEFENVPERFASTVSTPGLVKAVIDLGNHTYKSRAI